MPDYRRAILPGGTFFFTVVTEGRAPILWDEHARTLLRSAIADCRKSRPFVLDAMVLLPDHIHALWTLPQEDVDYTTRWAAIKARFTHEWLAAGGPEQRRTGSRVHERRRGVWQRRFWEHLIRDEDDYRRHLDYIHYNAVKHGHAPCPHVWRYSTFEKWVKKGVYEPTWSCGCDGRMIVTPSFAGLDELEMEMGE